VRALLALLLALALAGLVSAEPRVGVVATGMEVPWALAFAPDGVLYVTERPGRIRVVRDGRLDPTPIATLAVAAVGEGGLMGLALDPAFAETGRLYVCYTAARLGRIVNRVTALTVRGRGAVPERALLDDIPGASVHDGCRLKFGPDGKLYVGTGDAGQGRLAQRGESPAGKILRLNPDGGVPADNPFPGSPVYSLGHRNVQGLAWDARGRLLASEHGPSGFPGGHDEINLIRSGANYGWPEVYGKGGEPRYVDPLVESGRDTWAPSGIAVLGDHLYVAGLRGRRLLRMRLTAEGGVAEVTAWLAGTHGRLRDVVVGPDGALYVATSNRDGRGSPAADDDRILRVVP
jgi:glucose/arabinose dehydrogenase